MHLTDSSVIFKKWNLNCIYVWYDKEFRTEKPQENTDC